MHRFAPWHWLAPAIALFVMAFGSLTSGDGEQGELQQLIARGQARDLHPLMVATALHGELHNGLANDFYTQAGKLSRELHHRISKSEVREQTRWSEARQAPEMIELRKSWQPLLRLIEQGAHSRRLATEPTWHILWSDTIVRYECDALLEERQPEHALHVWLDGVTEKTDAVREAPNDFSLTVGSSGVRRLIEFWTTKRLDLLSRETKRQLHQALAELDKRLGSSCDLERLVCSWAKDVTSQRFNEWQPTWHQRLSAWKDGFSPQQRVVRETKAIVRHLPELAPAEMHWPARRQQLDALRFDPVWHKKVMTWERDHRQALASLRQLRGTLLQQAGQTSESLTDPLGSGQLFIEPR